MNRGLYRYASFTACATFFLIVAGGLVTSTGSGLAVPDWPLSYGMFFPPMVGGIFYEHGHRMVAAAVGLLTIGLAVWLARKESRPWLRRLGWVAVGAVCLQALLGGITVLYLLPTPVSVAHACLAQTFFCILLAVAAALSPAWGKGTPDEERPAGRRLARYALWLSAAVYIQLVLGAMVRHTGAGLAIPDVPLSFGRLWPPHFDSKIAIHFAHRLWALLVVGSAWALLARAWALRRRAAGLRALALAALAAAHLQVLLGGLTVWSEREVRLATAHVALGALLLGGSFLLALLASRRYGAGLRIRPADYWALTKPRVTGMVLLSTLTGYYLGSTGPVDRPRLAWTLLATFLVAAGASALNQFLERRLDGLMARTAARPLPAGRLAPRRALAFAVSLSLLGLSLFLLFLDVPTAATAAVCSFLYLFVYTPLKKITPLCTWIGAVAGALPPVIGWVAAGGRDGPGAWVLFGILFLWQLPHFFAISWIYREDYARARFRVLSVLDPSGRKVSRQIVVNCLGLAFLATAPAFVGLAGPIYLAGTLPLAAAFLALSVGLAARRTRAQARRVLLASVVYLPALMLLMAADKA